MGITNSRTMKLKGEIIGNKVILMIDPGATNNFISLNTIHKLNLPYSFLKFGVTLDNGDKILGEGKCKQPEIRVQGVVIIEDFLILELGNTDIIMGLQWLEKLGEITTNWKEQVMKYNVGTHQFIPRDPSLGVTQISLKAMERMSRKEKHGVLIKVSHLQKNDKPAIHDPPSYLQPVLQHYQSFLSDPLSLPPVRQHDHAITLKDGVNSVNVRPYRYPQIQE